MKLLVCGSRDMPEKHKGLVLEKIYALLPHEIISGGARGADKYAEEVAKHLNIPIIVMKADWNKHGKAAGPIRNQEMLDEKPDMVLAFYPKSGITKGTLDMVTRAKKAKVAVIEVQYE